MVSRINGRIHRLPKGGTFSDHPIPTIQVLKKQRTNPHAIFLFQEKSPVCALSAESCIEVGVGITVIGIAVEVAVAATVMTGGTEATEGIANENGGMRSSGCLFLASFPSVRDEFGREM